MEEEEERNNLQRHLLSPPRLLRNVCNVRQGLTGVQGALIYVSRRGLHKSRYAFVANCQVSPGSPDAFRACFGLCQAAMPKRMESVLVLHLTLVRKEQWK
jgi:hypothetical protein